MEGYINLMNKKNQTSPLTEDVGERHSMPDARWLRYAFRRDKLKKMAGVESKKKKPIYVKDEEGSRTMFQCPECKQVVDADDAIVISPGKIACSICAAKNHGVFESFKKWLALSEASYSEKKAPRSTKMVDNYKEKLNKGSIDMSSHLKDYVSHIEKLGDGLGPFKVLKRRGKPVAPVAH